MPIFTEGQDPLDQTASPPPGRMPTGQPEPEPFSGPSKNVIVGAAFRQNNPVVSVLDAITRSRPDMTPVADYNPVARLKGTENDDLIDQSLADVNPAQTDARIAKKQAERKDQQTLAASGGFGTVASIAAGALDPSWFIPIVGELHGAAELGIAARALRAGAEGAVKSAISESVLQQSQATRTAGDSASNIATNTLLMGLLGGGMAMLDRGSTAGAMAEIRQRSGLPPAAEAPPPGITAFHGSPHSFDAFSSAKIGSGEGAQAYGHGLYFAEDEKIAGGYQKKLSGDTEQGALYQVRINADPEWMLDWDKPLNEQSEHVKNALATFGVEPTSEAFGRDILNVRSKSGMLVHFDEFAGMDPQEISAALHDAGIPGIRYLDAGSRKEPFELSRRGMTGVDHFEYPTREAAQAHIDKAVKDGDSPDLFEIKQVPQTRNYVVFNDKYVQITHKNGAPIQTAAAEGLDKVREDLSPHDPEAAPPIVPDHETAPPVLASDLSAAESDQRTMKLSRILLPENLVLGARNIPGVGGAIGAAYDWTAATMMRFSPTLRVFSSESMVAKRAMGDLAETALRFTQSEAGITTARGGVPIDRLVKMQTYKARMENSHILRDAFVEYRALEDKTAPIIRSQIEDVRGLAGGKMSFDDFKTEVTLAATNGDEHAIPQVQAAARLIRQKVLDPVKAMAQRTLGPDGKPMLAEELEAPKGDKSFFPRSWNKEAIAANYNGAKRVFSDWLEGEQGIKKAAQDRIAGHSRQLEMAEKRISDLEAKIEKLPEGDKARADLEYDARRAGETRDSIRGLVEKEIEAWEGDSSRAAKSALKARAKASEGRAPDMPRLRAADPEVDAAVRKILASSRDLTREELENRAAEIIHRINTAPDGRLAYEAGGGGQAVPTGAQAVRGSLNARDFAIPTALVKDFVHTDTEHVVSGFLRSTIPDIHLTDRFGDIEMTDVFRRLNEEYDRRLAGTTSGRESTRLDNERKAMVRDLAATRDRLRGIYGFQLAQSQPNAARIANAARSYNLIADLGTSVFNRLTDSTNAVWRHGLINVFGDGYGPFLKSALGMGEGFSTSARQSMKDMGVGIDGTLGHMAHQWGDVIDNYLPGSKFERAMTWAADKSMIVNLHGPWTDAMKTVAGTVAAADFLRTAERVSLGTHTEQDIQRLAQAGIAPHMAERIWKAYSEGGGQEFGRGTHVANTADWTDTHARDVFTSAIGRDADMAVLTPGMEKPLWMSGPVVSLLGQYKSFVAAAHEKVLISNLQQMDGRTLQGLVAAMGMGMLSYRAYTLWSGAPTSDRPQDWIKEGISRSAIGGWYTELNNIQAKFTGGNTDVFRAIGADHPMSRRQSNSALSELLGPTYSKLEGIAGGLNDASHGTWTAQDTHKLRQALWLQNLFATRRLLDSVEDGFNDAIGVKPINRDAATWPGAAAH